MPSRHHRIDRSIREPQWTIRIVTLAILLAGVAAVAWAFMRGENRRERLLAGLEVGDTTAHIVSRLGDPPAVCETGSLDHLEGQFPGGWPGAAQARAIEMLREQTVARWVYPLTEAHTDPCAAPQNATEFGIGADDRVRWFVPVAGRQPLRLPADMAPGAALNDTD